VLLSKSKTTSTARRRSAGRPAGKNAQLSTVEQFLVAKGRAREFSPHRRHAAGDGYRTAARRIMGNDGKGIRFCRPGQATVPTRVVGQEATINRRPSCHELSFQQFAARAVDVKAGHRTH